jgi:uncharacterized membrane protein YciS (DUF1049 family)
MKLFKGFVFFGAAFVLAWVIIFTFSQPEFRNTASVVFFSKKSREFPLFVYVAGAFSIGLILGLGLALYYAVAMKLGFLKRDREIRRLEEESASYKGPDGGAEQRTEEAAEGYGGVGQDDLEKEE